MREAGSAVFILLFLAGCATSPLKNGRYWPLDQCVRATSQQVRFSGADGSGVVVRRATCERMASAAGKIQTAANYRVSNIYLADADQMNAFSFVDKRGAPTIVVTLAMANALGDDEAAWGGLLGHETAHLVQHHGEGRKRAQAEAYGVGQAVATGIGLLIPGVGGVIGGTVGGTFAQTAVFGAHTRPEEAEADDLGLRWTVQAGLDPRGMERLFDVLDKQQSLPEFLSTHPAPENRAAKIRAFIQAQAAQPAKPAGLTEPGVQPSPDR